MAHCPVCNMEVDDLKQHAMAEANKGDQSHKEAMKKMQGGMGEHSAGDGHDHGKM